MGGSAASLVDRAEQLHDEQTHLGIATTRHVVDHFLAGTLDTYEEEMRTAAAVFEQVVLAFYEGSFLDIVLAPRAYQPARYRQAIISLMAGDVFGGGPPEAQRVARSFPAIARAIRNHRAQAS